MNSFDFLMYISTFSVFLPIFISIIRFKAFNFALKALFLFCVISLVTDAISYYFATHRINSTFIYNLYALISGILSVIIIHQSFITENKLIKTIHWSLLGIITLVSVFSLAYNDGTSRSDFATNFLFGIFIILSCLFSFYLLLQGMIVDSLKEYYFFWIISAFLLSKSLTLFIFITEDYIRANEDDVAYLLWIINLVSNIGFNILISIGIWKKR